MRLALVLLAALTGCSSMTPCGSANAEQDDPALQTCVYSTSLDPAGSAALDPADGAPVAMTIPPAAPDREPMTLPDGTRLVASYFGVSWDGTGGDLSPADTASAVTAVAVSGDGYALGMRAGGRVFWQAASGESVAEGRVRDGVDEVVGWPNRATHLALAPDASVLAAADALHEVTVWDPSGVVLWRASLGDDLVTGDGIRALAVSPDGRHVAAATRYAVWLWDAASGEPIAQWAHPGKTTITGVFFAPDGEHVAVRKAGRYTASTTRVTTRDDDDQEQGFARTVDDGPSQSAPTLTLWRLP